MDVSDITKVATRKRMSEDAEKLRDKISRETAKIIKLKVAQDTAYWDLKEKLQQVECNHERLQQNMVEVQMQHETISGQYQDELRFRPEILNKVRSVRALCAAVEEWGARVRDGVGRARADGAELRARGARAAAAARRRLRAVSELQAGAAREAAAARDRNDRIIAEMQRDTQRRENEFESRVAALDHIVVEQRQELEARAAAAAAGEAAAAGDLRRLRAALTAAEADVANLKETVASFSGANERLTDELKQKEQALERRDADVQELEAKVASLETEKGSLVAEASAAEEARARAEEQRERLQEQLRDLQLRQQQLTDDFAQYRSRGEREAAAQAAAQAAVAADKEAQLAAAADAIARLMRDVQAEADARHRLELAAKGKDDELARHLALLGDMRADNERLRGTIASMQATIDNIQKELTGRLGGGAGGGAGGAVGGARCQRPERLRAEAAPVDRMLYNFLSDASNDADTHDSPLSLSQVKNDLNSKGRAFFKNKKFEVKHKKHK